MQSESVNFNCGQEDLIRTRIPGGHGRGSQNWSAQEIMRRSSRGLAPEKCSIFLNLPIEPGSGKRPKSIGCPRADPEGVRQRLGATARRNTRSFTRSAAGRVVLFQFRERSSSASSSIGFRGGEVVAIRRAGDRRRALAVARARARSIRIRRIASAAAAKKCARLANVSDARSASKG